VLIFIIAEIQQRRPYAFVKQFLDRDKTLLERRKNKPAEHPRLGYWKNPNRRLCNNPEAAFTADDSTFTAKVRGSQPRPYQCRIELRALNEQQWEHALQSVADSPLICGEYFRTIDLAGKSTPPNSPPSSTTWRRANSPRPPEALYFAALISPGP